MDETEEMESEQRQWSEFSQWRVDPNRQQGFGAPAKRTALTFYNGGQFIRQTPWPTVVGAGPESFMSITTVTVQPGSFLTLHYRLAGPGGDIINTFDGKPATLSLGTGELSPAVEQRLLGLEEGTRATFQIPAGEAFGERKPEMVQWVARRLLNQLGDPDETYRVGDVVQFPTPDGLGQYAGAVQQVGKPDGSDAVLFDFNHPLADQPVTFEVLLVGVL